MTEEKLRIPRVRRRDERLLIRLAVQAIHSDFLNPDRLGCLGRDTLEAIVKRGLSIPEVDDAIDHIATCAPCFDEYTNCRRRQRHRFAGRVAVACIAGLGLTLAVWWRVSPARFPVRGPLAVRSANPTFTATLDFRNRTVERSGHSNLPEGVEMPHLRRALLAITVKLPIGTEDGGYSVQIRDGQDRTVVDAAGTAKWDGSTEVLITTLNLGRLRAGDYVLAIAKNGSSWRKYPVRLE